MAEPKNEKGAPKGGAKKDAKPAKGGGETRSARARENASAVPFIAPADYVPRLKKHYNEGRARRARQAVRL